MLRRWAWASIVVGMLCGVFAAMPRLVEAQASPTIIVETEQISGPSGQVVLDITLDTGGEVITALTFDVLFSTDELTATGFELVAPADGAFNARTPGRVRVGSFYTIDAFDPNDPGGFTGAPVIARIELMGNDVAANSLVDIEVIEAFDGAEQLISLVQVPGGVTVPGAPTPTITPTVDPTLPTPTVTPTTVDLPTPTPTPTPTATVRPPDPSLGALGGYIWLDTNVDGLQDSGEGVAGITVTVVGPSGTRLTESNDAGTYIIDGLLPGSYDVAFTTPPGGSWTVPNVGFDDTIDSDADATGSAGIYVVVAGVVNNTVDAGLATNSPGPGGLGGYVWEDINEDGIQDQGEGVAGVRVTAVGPTGTVFDVTDANGEYLISSLMPGTYQVTFSAPAGRTWTLQDIGDDDAVDSDADSNGNAGQHVVPGGDINSSVDAGLIPAAAEAPTPTATATVVTVPSAIPTATVAARPSTTATATATVGAGPTPTATATAAGVAAPSPTATLVTEDVIVAGPDPTATATATPTAESGFAPQIPYTGPFKVVPEPQAAVGGFGLNPQPAADQVLGVVDAGGGTTLVPASQGADTGAVPLANTGAQTPVFATLSISLMTLGAAMLVSARRQRVLNEQQ